MGNKKRKRNKKKNQQAVRRRSHSHETQNPEEIELAPHPSSAQQHADLRLDPDQQEYPSGSRNLGHDRERQGQDPRQFLNISELIYFREGNSVEPAAPDQQDEEIGRLKRQIRDQEIRQENSQLRKQLVDRQNRKWRRIFLFILEHFIMASISCVIILLIMAYTKKPSPTLIEYFLWVIITFFVHIWCISS
uniref:Uncharacterized protein n=1 Tax=Acrobeloides nanus TaxID=290746 RepID=A0A914CFD3_9BILA